MSNMRFLRSAFFILFVRAPGLDSPRNLHRRRNLQSTRQKHCWTKVNLVKLCRC